MPTLDQQARLRALEQRRGFVRRIEFNTHSDIPQILSNLAASGKLAPDSCVFCVPSPVTVADWEARTREQQASAARGEYPA